MYIYINIYMYIYVYTYIYIYSIYIYIYIYGFFPKRAAKTVLLSVLDENLTKILFSLFSKVLVGTLQRLQKNPKWAKTEKKEFLTKVFLMFTFLKIST